MDSLNMEDEFHQINLSKNVPQTYAKSFKVLPPFETVPSRIPTRIGGKTVTKYLEDDVEKDFLRGSTVSQSFIRKTPERKISTYEQNFLVNTTDWKPKKKVFDNGFREVKTKTTVSRLEQPLMDEVSARYTEYGNGYNNQARNKNATHIFQPPSPDRAEL